MDVKAVSSHLIEIRNRGFKCTIIFVILFACIYPFAGQLFDIAAQPILVALPKASSIIATEVTSPFFMPLKLNFYLSMLICAPYLFYHIWGFMGPALLRHEKRFLLPISFLSLVLFYIGFATSYFIVLPVLFNFFISVSPSSVQVMTSMSNLLNFIINTSFIVGLIFQIPIVMTIIVKFGFVERRTLAKGRRFAILGAFVIAMIIAPDVLFQAIFAGPIYVMYELGLFISRFVEPKKQNNQKAFPII
ncbi:twin-arginine translocase subunit TatC [Fangia hongkongensis]|uniref:twin-arginine translocase subunit TatC n=1 Tax=Fangia hongkongensis TaxID=270495 RepID=UPI0003689F3B|nr:twin-arginine translocase subunit TatC [Fangia hongkongensis]